MYNFISKLVSMLKDLIFCFDVLTTAIVSTEPVTILIGAVI